MSYDQKDFVQAGAREILDSLFYDIGSGARFSKDKFHQLNRVNSIDAYLIERALTRAMEGGIFVSKKKRVERAIEYLERYGVRLWGK